jgi:hypothetical protein
MIRWVASVVAWGLALALSLGGGTATAQQAEFPSEPQPAPDAAGATPPPAPPAAEAACFPACRSGFVCHQGQCVSLCNPPCAGGERCLANGECEPSPDARESRTEHDEVEVEEDPRKSSAVNAVLRPPGSFVFAARAGLQVVGGGHAERTCSSTGQFTCTPTSDADFDERSYVRVGVDGLFHAARGLRLGLGYDIVPYVGVQGENDEEVAHLGHEHGLGAVVEGMIAVSPRFALALRAQGGLRMLVLGGDLADSGDQFLSNCYEADAVRCEVDEGPMLGSGFGVMFGFVGGSRVRWRVDLALDRTTMKLPTASAQYTMEDSVKRTSTLYATRSWVLGGLEL